MDGGAWWAAVHGVAKSRTRLRDFTFTFHFHALATHSSVLAWRIPGTEEPRGLPSMGSHRVGHDWSNLAAAATKELCFYYLYLIIFTLPFAVCSCLQIINDLVRLFYILLYLGLSSDIITTQAQNIHWPQCVLSSVQGSVITFYESRRCWNVLQVKD